MVFKVDHKGVHLLNLPIIKLIQIDNFIFEKNRLIPFLKIHEVIGSNNKLSFELQIYTTKKEYIRQEISLKTFYNYSIISLTEGLMDQKTLKPGVGSQLY